MLKVDNELNIYLVQGDSVNFRLYIKNHKLQYGDKICFIIHSEDEKFVFREDLINFKEGYAYFNLTPTQTYSLPSNLRYSVRLVSGDFRATLLYKKEFNVKRGFELC